MPTVGGSFLGLGLGLTLFSVAWSLARVSPLLFCRLTLSCCFAVGVDTPRQTKYLERLVFIEVQSHSGEWLKLSSERGAITALLLCLVYFILRKDARNTVCPEVCLENVWQQDRRYVNLGIFLGKVVKRAQSPEVWSLNVYLVASGPQYREHL